MNAPIDVLAVMDASAEKITFLAQKTGVYHPATDLIEARAAVAEAFTALRKIANGEHSEGQTDGQIIGRMMETARVSLMRCGDPESFCDGNCVWTDHHPDCALARVGGAS